MTKAFSQRAKSFSRDAARHAPIAHVRDTKNIGVYLGARRSPGAIAGRANSAKSGSKNSRERYVEFLNFNAREIRANLFSSAFKKFQVRLSKQSSFDSRLGGIVPCGRVDGVDRRRIRRRIRRRGLARYGNSEGRVGLGGWAGEAGFGAMYCLGGMPGGCCAAWAVCATCARRRLSPAVLFWDRTKREAPLHPRAAHRTF